MSTPAEALKSHWQRRTRQGFTRVEVTVHKRDAELVRNVAKALRDPQGSEAARAFIRLHLANKAWNFKEFLPSAPLEGVDLTQPLDFGRDIDL
jgi:hypothetical protein